MRVVVGLGNPGRKYEKTRHNVGYDVLAELAKRWHAGAPRSKFESEYCELSFAEQRVLLISPLTYMNASGRAVRKFADFFQVQPADILVICDDFNLPVGKLRFRPSGSAGGQKGLADILRQMGTQEVPRLRLGIGPLPPKWNVSDFVLSRFGDQREEIDELIQVGADGVADWVREDTQYCMNRYNGYPNLREKKPASDKTESDKTESDKTESDKHGTDKSTADRSTTDGPGPASKHK